ncbi:MAG: adenylate kinase [Myxococcota bacterium]
MISEDPEYPLGRRIAVIGKGGKTTLSRALGERFGLEFIEQDSIRHRANWTELSDDRHREAAIERFDNATAGWVSDGNYPAVLDIVYERVDTVIVLALPLRVMLWRTLMRSLRRMVTREELWNGNRESFLVTLFSRDSVVYDLYLRRNEFRSFAEVAEARTPSRIRLVILRSPRELKLFYAAYGLVRR